MRQYYRFNHSDLTNITKEKYEYYTMEELKENVKFTVFDDYEENWEGGTWFVYRGDSCMSSYPMLCASKQEAYENLLEAENQSLYECYYDL